MFWRYLNVVSIVGLVVSLFWLGISPNPNAAAIFVLCVVVNLINSINS